MSVLLGTADLRLMRLMLAHVVSSALLTFVSAYVSGLPSRAPVDPRLLTMLSTLIQLVASPQPPAGGSNASAPLPPTAITQTIITAHLTPLLIAAVMAGWTPTAPPATFASIRASLLTALAGLPATQALASLGTSLKLLQSGRKSKPRGWVRSWPPYADGALGTLMSGQMQRPGGVKAVMENVFGEAANLLGPEGVDGSKLDQIAGVLSRVPRNVAPEVYIPQLLTTLFDLIAPESATHPLVYTHTAAYVVHHLWNSSPIAVNWLRERLHVPLLPANLSVGVVATPEGVQSLLTALSQLVTHAPPSPQFVDFLIAPILPPLFALHVALLTPSKAGIIEKRPEATGLAASVHMVLLAWGKVVPQAEGVKGVWTVVQGGKGWPEGEGGREIFWRRTGDGAELVYD